MFSFLDGTGHNFQIRHVVEHPVQLAFAMLPIEVTTLYICWASFTGPLDTNRLTYVLPSMLSLNGT